MTSNQVQISQIFSEFTQYENEDVKEIYTTLDDCCKVQQVYSPAVLQVWLFDNKIIWLK